MSALLRAIAPGIAVYPAETAPLSADVGFLEGREHTWLFDLGASGGAAEAVRRASSPVAVLSHFHADHTANAARLPEIPLLCSRETARHTGRGTVVDAPRRVEDGFSLEILPFPSGHCRGSLILVVDGTYAFLGDALYPSAQSGLYNATVLRETIRALRGLSAPRLLLSHREPLLAFRPDELSRLESIYARRRPGEPYIREEA